MKKKWNFQLVDCRIFTLQFTLQFYLLTVKRFYVFHGFEMTTHEQFISTRIRSRGIES